MIVTIVIPNRNRDLAIVKRNLNSLIPQAGDSAQIVLVDYGSDHQYQKELQALVEKLENVKLILCPTQSQLWNKSRAINIVLKTCETPFFMVADVDMLVHPKFCNLVLPILKKNRSIYFPVGVLTEAESKKEQAFDQYQVKFITNDEATGISIFPTDQLLAIHGFDEFYHGWGSEDTDVHVRLRNSGQEVVYQEGTCYFLHQWHPKGYRSRDSKEPYCHGLEQTNAGYLEQTRTLKKTKANTTIAWGVLPKPLDSKVYDSTLSLTNKTANILAFVKQLTDLESNTSLLVKVSQDPNYKTVKDGVKKMLGKKTIEFMSLEEANDIILGALTGALRNSAYNYHYDAKTQEITLQILILR